VLTTHERPLTPAELQRLSTRLKTIRTEAQSALATYLTWAILAWVFLLLFTLGTARTSTWAVILFWTLLVFSIAAWMGVSRQRAIDEGTGPVKQAMRTNLARVAHVQATRVIEFEKDDYESVCYAFEIGADSSLFIVGDEIAAGDRFPNSDFSIVEILAERGRPIDRIVEKRGVPLAPVAVIPNATKSLMVVPEHMSVLPLALDRITEGLPHRRR